MTQFVPDEQLDVELYRRDDRWRIRIALGHAGREHAQTMRAQDFECPTPLAAALISSASLAVAPADIDVAEDVRDFFTRNDPEGPFRGA